LKSESERLLGTAKRAVEIAVEAEEKTGSSDFGVINKDVKKQYDIIY